MQIRFYLNPETGELYIHGHAVVESEVAEAFANVLEDGGGEGGARVAIGRTDAGRYIRIIYSPDPEPESVFVITAYDLGPKALWALRRRLRRRS